MLTKEQILSAEDLDTIEVNVPEWGVGATVILKTLSGFDRDAHEGSLFEQKGKDRVINTRNVRARLVAKCLVDESGVKLFGDKHAVEALGRKSSAVLDRLYDRCLELNGMTDKAVEDAEGNSGADLSENSSTD
jgi:hypothetical protein